MKQRIAACLLAFTFALTACLAQPIAPTATPTLPPPTALPAPPTPTLQPSAQVDVGSRTLFYRCQGEGSPAVIIEAGLSTPGASSGVWDPVALRVAGATRVCLYDRANMGRSKAAAKPRTSRDIARDLHTLLVNAHISAPYVLVGHSIGGYHVRVYAAEYPQEVAGIVLVDSSHPDQFERWLDRLPTELPNQERRLQDLREYFTIRPDYPAQNAEGFDMLAGAEQVRAAGSLGTTPLVVLTRSPKTNPLNLPPELDATVEQVWMELQNELAALSSNSTHIYATRAGHNIQRDEPQAVVDAVLGLVDDIRTKHAAQ